MGRRIVKRRDACAHADRVFLRYVRDADLETLLRMQAAMKNVALWRRIAIDRAVMRHVFGA